jgi:hypothetical protein
MDTGNRKFGLASLVAGGMIAAGEWKWAFGVYVVYTISNLLSRALGDK